MNEKNNRKYVVDAYAWIEYLRGSRAGGKVKAILEGESNEVYTCAVTVAEVVSKVAREGGDFEAAYDILVSNSQIFDVDERLSREVGILNFKMRRLKSDFGLADAYVLAVARRINCRILTGDIHFEGVKEAILI
ncbi:MAG: PIN domain-containing protein [Candidatus Bathyarchaeia archaeon]